jgi:hypothetical protein
VSQLVLTGLDGSSPLGFMAAVGLLRLVHGQSKAVRLGFSLDGTFRPVLQGVELDVAGVIAEDAQRAFGKQSWSLDYEKHEKKGTKIVSDLKAPPPVFARFLEQAVELWLAGAEEAAAYAAAFGTSVAVDGKGNTKPTAFHFTAANQQFLGTLEAIRASMTREWVTSALFEEHSNRPGANLRWDPAAERNWALMAGNPNDEGTNVNAPLEWLAFRALPLFPCFPRGSRVITTAISGRGEDMKLVWPLWSPFVSLETVRSLLQMSWATPQSDRAQRGVLAVCQAPIRRTAQGFGNFGPSAVLA